MKISNNQIAIQEDIKAKMEDKDKDTEKGLLVGVEHPLKQVGRTSYGVRESSYQNRFKL